MSLVFEPSRLEQAAAFVHDSLSPGLSAESPYRSVPWTELPEEIRESNRAQIRGVASHLATLSLRTVALGHPCAITRLPEKAVEKVSMDEHARWAEAKRADGYVFGQERDDVAKVHPWLVDWQDLCEPIRELDRQRVRLIPRIVELLGYALVDGVEGGISSS